MVVNGNVYVTAGDGKLYCYNTDNSELYASRKARQAAAARRPDMHSLVPDPEVKLPE
jgi:outer membrane protein assembly factor BamB